MQISVGLCIQCCICICCICICCIHICLDVDADFNMALRIEGCICIYCIYICLDVNADFIMAQCVKHGVNHLHTEP